MQMPIFFAAPVSFIVSSSLSLRNHSSSALYASSLYIYVIIVHFLSKKVNQDTVKKNARNLSIAGVSGGD